MDEELLKKTFASLGFDIIHYNKPKSANGVDLWIQRKGKRPLSVEIKKARRHSKGMFTVDPVQKNRQTDDLIAIIMNSQYVLVESMSDHLKCCSPKGTRQFTLIIGD